MSTKPPEPTTLYGAGIGGPTGGSSSSGCASAGSGPLTPGGGVGNVGGGGGGVGSAAGLVHAFPPRAMSDAAIYSPSALYAAAAAAQAAYLPFAASADSSAFFPPPPPLSGNDGGAAAAEVWRNFSAAQTAAAAAAWAYDPTVVGYPYGPSYGALDVRRKNATRESTSTLKAWLYEHIKNPYPTKGEKIMLAIITKMTLTQVSTWFANARRRLKKENKMQWSPRNRTGDDDDDDDDKNSDVDDVIGDVDVIDRRRQNGDDDSCDDIDVVVDVGNDDDDDGDDGRSVRYRHSADSTLHDSRLHGPFLGARDPFCWDERSARSLLHSGVGNGAPPPPDATAAKSADEPPPARPEKPRIWSLADVATSGCTPSSGRGRSPPTLPPLSGSETTRHIPPPSLLGASSTSGFQPWTNGLSPTSPTPRHAQSPTMTTHRPFQPPPSASIANGLMRYGPFVIGMGGPHQTAHPAAAMAVSQQLAAAAAAHAAAVNAAIQARLQQQGALSADAAGRGRSSASVGTRSPPVQHWPGNGFHHSNGNRIALEELVKMSCAGAPSVGSCTSRDSSPSSCQPTPTSLAQTAFKPVTPRRL